MLNPGQLDAAPALEEHELSSTPNTIALTIILKNFRLIILFSSCRYSFRGRDHIRPD